MISKSVVVMEVLCNEHQFLSFIMRVIQHSSQHEDKPETMEECKVGEWSFKDTLYFSNRDLNSQIEDLIAQKNREGQKAYLAIYRLARLTVTALIREIRTVCDNETAVSRGT